MVVYVSIDHLVIKPEGGVRLRHFTAEMVNFRVAERFIVSQRALIEVDQALWHVIDIAELTTLHLMANYLGLIEVI